MTVALTTSSITYTADGTTTVFAIPFEFLQTSQIYARTRTADNLTIVQKYIGTDFSVSGAGAAGGGSLTFYVAPAAALLVDIVRWVQPLQNVNLANLGPFPSLSVEVGFDEIVRMVQQIINAGGGDDPFAFAGLPTGAPTIPNGSVTQDQLSLTGNTVLTIQAPVNAYRLAYGGQETAVSGSFVVNRPNGADGNRGTGAASAAVFTDVADAVTYPSRDIVGLYSEANAAARFGESTNATTTYTATTVNSTAWTVDISRVPIGAFIDTAHSPKWTGKVTAVNPTTGTITVSGWYQYTGSIGTPADGTKAILLPVTKIWAQNSNLEWWSYSDTITQAGTGHEVGIDVRLSGVTGPIVGFDAVNLGTDATTGVLISGHYKGNDAFTARGVWDSGFTAAITSVSTCYGFHNKPAVANAGPTVAFYDDSASTHVVYATGGAHTTFLNFFDASASAVASLAYNGDFVTVGNVVGKLRSLATAAGAPTGGSDGDIVLDTTNHRLYIKDGGSWRYAALT